MSITSDIRAYADNALEQGKTQLTQVIDQAQASFTVVTEDVTSRVSGIGAKASATVDDLRTQAEKVLNIDAVKAAVEPYLAQAREYRAAVTDRANGLVGTVTADPRVSKVVDTAESFSRPVVETVQTRVVKPVVTLAGRAPAGRKPATGPATKPAATSATQRSTTTAAKPASTRPAPKPAAKVAGAAKSSSRTTSAAAKSGTRSASASAKSGPRATKATKATKAPAKRASTKA
jgi:hypothetical protein